MRHPVPSVMIFAAGFGTRMHPLTLDRPKPLIEVGGRALIDHSLDLARVANPSRIIVNAHYKAEMIDAYLKDTDVTVLVETPDILDTGGGLKNALPILDSDTVLTLNADAIWSGPNPLSMVIESWDPAKMDALLCCVPMAQTRGRTTPGDFDLRPDGRLVRGTNYVYGGVQIMKPDILNDIDETVFSLNKAWDRMHKSGRLFGLSYPGLWCDVGTPAGIPLAEQVLGHG